jgi:fumarate hydratase class I
MKQELIEILTDKITEAVYNLCKQANIYIPKDVYASLYDSYVNEKSSRAKNVLWQILENIKLASESGRPICQDTGVVVVFAEIGQNAHISGLPLEEAINKGVETAYNDCFFRKSIVKDPIFTRVNTGTNTPAVIHTKIVAGNTIKLTIAIKGCGSENMSAAKMLKPAAGVQGIIDFIVETVKTAGANPCPPIRLGIGVGGTMDYATLLSKKALLEPIKSESVLQQMCYASIQAAKPLNQKFNETIPSDITTATVLTDINMWQPQELPDKITKLELEILKKLNKLNIGAAGLGGDTTVFGVNILHSPTHIAALPVAVNINCHASRHASAVIVEDKIKYNFDNYQYEFADFQENESFDVRVETSETEKIRSLKAGQKVLLSGYIYTARDAAHKKLIDCINMGEDFPIDIKDKIIYYVGPCPSMPDEIIGPAGPTTAGRMDKFTPVLLERDLLGMIGKGERSEQVRDSIKENKGIYFVATGGAACLLQQRIIESEVIAYPELGAEAIFKLKIKDFPVIVAIDSNGESVFA